MTQEQQEHLAHIISEFKRLYPPKYRKGAVEHGGFLGDIKPLDLAYMLLEEGMDTIAYAITLIDQLKYQEE